MNSFYQILDLHATDTFRVEQPQKTIEPKLIPSNTIAIKQILGDRAELLHLDLSEMVRMEITKEGVLMW